MLFRTILLPSALSAAPVPEEASEFFYPAAIRLLQDLAENCVLIIAGSKEHPATSGVLALYTAMDKWPERYRIPGQKALQLLEKRKRVVVLEGEPAPCDRCEIPSCRNAIGAAASLRVEAPTVIAGGNCISCSSSTLGRAAVSVLSYPTSEFLRKRRRSSVVLLSNGEWRQDRFEAEVLAPILRDAGVVKLYDRIIGQKILPRESAGPPPVACSIPPNYALTLDWIFRAFGRQPGSVKKIAEIYTSIDTSYMDNRHIDAAVKAVEEFVAGTVARTGVRPSVFLKTETDRLRMAHGRYLITDRIGFLVERGFDLLWDDATMKKAGEHPSTHARPIRDVMISLCPYAERIETTTAKLRDFRVIS